METLAEGDWWQQQQQSQSWSSPSASSSSSTSSASASSSSSSSSSAVVMPSVVFSTGMVVYFLLAFLCRFLPSILTINKNDTVSKL
jgi:hypothetical protein